LGSYDGISVIAPACHDTGSAVAAVPTSTKAFAYISSGTWSLVGLEVPQPILTPEALAANVTNEGGVYGTYRLLKNVMGLWILQQCRAAWAAVGQEFSYGELVQLAEQAEPLSAIFNPNDPIFLQPGNHPQHIRDLCQRTGQPVPHTVGAVVRSVLESLALAYREVLELVQGYRSNLLGSDQRITNTGGGNTSAKITETDPLTGQPPRCSGSRAPAATCARARARTSRPSTSKSSSPAVALRRARRQRPQGSRRGRHGRHVGPRDLQPEPPRPSSIDTPLHSFLPGKHVDHMHPNAIIAIAASQNCEKAHPGYLRRRDGLRAVDAPRLRTRPRDAGDFQEKPEDAGHHDGPARLHLVG
jgi:hypothetical protein